MTKKRIVGGATALVAALLMTAAAFAQHGGMPGGGPGGHHRGGHGGPLGHLARELNLSDAQKAQVKQLTDSLHESVKALHEQAGRSGGGPFDGLKDGAFDEAAVRAAAQARAAAHVEMEVMHARLMSQVYALLTAEQKAKLAELRQQHEQQRAQRRQTPPDGENF